MGVNGGTVERQCLPGQMDMFKEPCPNTASLKRSWLQDRTD